MLARLKAKLKGWRTTVGATAIGLVGALQLIGTVDISPLLRVFLKDDQIIGAIMVVMAIGGVFMRYVTTTPIGVGPPAPPPPAYNHDGVDSGF
jgi:hypothetical protein